MIYMYYHGGSANHGCEAIVRTTCKLLDCNVTLCSTNPASDKKYGIDSIVPILDDSVQQLSGLEKLQAALYFKTHGNSDFKWTVFRHKNFFRKVKKGDICISIGGDNYCYTGQDILAHYNKELHKRGAKTVLWGCSVEPNLIQGDIAKDLAAYDLIIARETYSYEALKKVNPHTHLCFDPAFLLEKKEGTLPVNFLNGNTVGINLSPLVLGKGSQSGIVYENYLQLIRYIIEETDMNIAFIPHVVCADSDDRLAMLPLYEHFLSTNRVCMIEDCDCEKLKGYISKCRFLVTARTHASIAAYSTCVPTLVVGYSIKAKGIAKDLFGIFDNYVVPIQELKNPDEITGSFLWLMNNEDATKQRLQDLRPQYNAAWGEALHQLKNI